MPGPPMTDAAMMAPSPPRSMAAGSIHGRSADIPAPRSAKDAVAMATNATTATSVVNEPRDNGNHVVPSAMTARPNEVTPIESVSRGRPSRRRIWCANMMASPMMRATGTSRR